MYQDAIGFTLRVPTVRSIMRSIDKASYPHKREMINSDQEERSMIMQRTVQVGLPEASGIRETMAALRRAISIDDVREVEDTDMYFSRALDAVLDVHDKVNVAVSGMMCDPTVTITCVDDGQEWPCATIAALCAALGVSLP